MTRASGGHRTGAGLYRDIYQGFTVTRFHGPPRERHGYNLSYTVTKAHLPRAELATPAKTLDAPQEASTPPDGGNDVVSECPEAHLADRGRGTSTIWS